MKSTYAEPAGRNSQGVFKKYDHNLPIELFFVLHDIITQLVER